MMSLPRWKYYLHTKHDKWNTTTDTMPLHPQDNYGVNSLQSNILILSRQSFLSWAKSSVKPTTFKSSLITSSKLFFGHPLPLLPSGMLIISHLLTRVTTLLLFTWPNHRSLISLILSPMGATLTKSLITPFLILSILVYPQIHLIILVSATINL